MQPRKILTISLLIDEVINDVELNTVKTADTVGGSEGKGATSEVRAKLQVGGTEGDEVIVMRLIGDSASQLRSKLLDYIVAITLKNTNSLADGDKDIVLEFNMPYRWNEAAMDSLVTATHRYVVCKSIERWQRMINRTDFAENYAREAAGALDDIMVAVSARKRPTRCTTYDIAADSQATWYVYKGQTHDGDVSDLLHIKPFMKYPDVENDGAIQYDTQGNKYIREPKEDYSKSVELVAANGQTFVLQNRITSAGILLDGEQYYNNNGLMKLDDVEQE